MAFLVYDQGVESPVAIWERAPLPEELAEGQVYADWVIINGDLDHSHYLIKDGVIEHVVPAPPEILQIPQPNLEGMCVAIMEDERMGTLMQRFTLIQSFKPLLKDYLSQGEYGQGWIYRMWSEVIKPMLEGQATGLSNLVFSHALANNIHLVPPEEESQLLALLQ